MQSEQRTIYTIVAVSVLALLFAGFVFTRKKVERVGAPVENSQVATTTGASSVLKTVSIPARSSSTVVGVPVSNKSQIPDFMHSPQYVSSIDSSTKVQLENQLTATQNVLRDQPSNFNAWLQLGNIYEVAGDYQAAAEAWQYVMSLYPANSISLVNLGGLYMTYLKNFSKAESFYRQAIANNPLNLGSYEGLFSLYTDYGYAHGTSTGENILKQGIVATPTSVDLPVLLARYYGAHGDKTDARSYYEKAISLAQSAGDSGLVSQLEQEESSL